MFLQLIKILDRQQVFGVNETVIVMEYCQFNLDQLPQNERKYSMKIFKNVLSGLKHIKLFDKIHGDIKD